MGVTITEDELQKAAHQITQALGHMKPTFAVSMALLGQAVLQLKLLNMPEGEVRRALEFFIKQHATASRIKLWYPSADEIRKAQSEWRERGHGGDSEGNT